MPYCVEGDKVYFLFQETKGGKKEGYLVDFGGGRKKGEDDSLMHCAAREFTEETAGLFTTDDVKTLTTELGNTNEHDAAWDPIIKKEVEKCLELVNVANHRGYVATTDLNQRWYASYAIQLKNCDLALHNEFFGNKAMRKVRVFQWVEGSVLLQLLKRQKVEGFLPLHPRVFALLECEPLVLRIISEEKQ